MFPISDSIETKTVPIFNIGIIAVTIYVFFQQIISPNPDLFISTYALIPSLVDFSNYATLFPFVTAIFLHGGFLHILSNMWFLWIFGDNIEERFGFLLFPFIYLVSGVAGNLLQYFIMPTSSIPMLGASGAVAGILGAYYVLFPHSNVKTLIPVFGFLTVVRIPASFMLGYWFVLQIISGAVSLPLSEGGGVAFWAHVGGFATGIFFAKVLK